MIGENMIYDRQPKMQYGFSDFNGNQWCNQWVDSYNNYTRSINKSAGIPIKTGSLTDLERNAALDIRHSFYVQVSDIANTKVRI